MNLTSHVQLGKMLQVAALVVIAAPASASLAFADNSDNYSITMKFDNQSNGSPPSLTSASTVGVDPSTNINLDNAASSGTLGLTQDLNGAASSSGASLTFADTAGLSYADSGVTLSSINTAFYEDGLVNDPTLSVNVTSLGANYTANGYSLYVYAGSQYGGNTSTYKLTDGAIVETPQGATPGGFDDTGYNLGKEYVVFSDLTGSNFTLTDTYSGGGTATLPGFQIVANVSAVPEPSTYALLLGGVVVLGFMVRRRQVRA